MVVDFAEVMARHTDAELLEIAASSEEEYQPAALEAAKAELARRNLTPERKRSAVEENQLKATDKRAKANTPLEVHWIILTFVSPGLGYLLFAERMRAEGKTRAARELTRFTLWAFGFYAALIVAAIVIGGVVGRISR